MLGWMIFKHALRMVVGNFRQVLQITVGPALIATVVLVVSGFLIGVPAETLATGVEEAVPEGAGAMGGLAFVFAILVFAVVFWVAVSWHRFVLLEEYPSGLLPVFHADRILAYFGRGVLLMLIAMAFGVPVFIVVGGLLESVPPLGAILGIVAYFFLVVAIMRLSITLPATAIGQPIRFAEAWENTKGASGAILVLLVSSFVFQIAVQLGIALFSLIPVLGLLVSIFVGLLIIPMINLSILTTMYGVFIEKRQLT